MLTYISYFIQSFLIILTFRIIYIIFKHTYVDIEEENRFKTIRFKFEFFPIEIAAIISLDTRDRKGQFEREQEEEFNRGLEELNREIEDLRIEQNERAFRAA